MTEPTHSGFDQPSIRDWKYNDVIPQDFGGSTKKINNETLLRSLKAWNQYKLTETLNACGFYGLTGNLNAQQLLEDLQWGIEHQTDPATVRIPRNENERPEGMKRRGTSLQGNLNYYRSKELLTGWAVCADLEETKRAIDNGDLIYTGSNNGDRTKTYQTGVYHVRTDGKIVGHLFFWLAYDDAKGGFRAWDSNGPKYGPFFVPYSLFSKFYSKNAVFGKKHADLITKYRNMSQYQIELDTALKNGITNGTNLDKPVTKSDAAVMCVRVFAWVMKEVLAAVDTKIQQVVDMINQSNKE